ncbi:geranylgeranyl reductase family protein [Acidihalobacter prosperus]|uniref:Geranylgeranyl reductase n=1 Tax=Acidihalobacter prosperus TaxID=160660 RepID=A0A1A6C6I9_9GAMM|nr:NAD(P)/FAD-dependent oxidoreductase [Acidihalobacter prosperus]OBS10173.1 geranylgeranyl reductase [Acidihalobacter prosperus]
MSHVQVLVVGLGPGGASAARKAAEAGLEVLGIERNRSIGEPVQCAEFVPTPMGAYTRADQVLYQRISGMKSILPSGEAHQSDFPGFMINRARFDQAIAEQAEQAGARLRVQTRIERLDPTARVALLRHADGTESVSYDVLIAADGPHSTVAKLLGLPALATVNTRQYTVPLLTQYADTDIWLSDEYPGGYAWLFPKGNRANLGLGADRRFEDDLKKPLESLHRQLVAAGLVGEEIYYRTGGAIPVGGLRERLVHQRCLFVGDAAGLTHPITGGGISAAVVSGERAGECAGAFVSGADDAFDDYEEDVRDQFEATIERAVARRAYLNRQWRTQAAQSDDTMRKGWIAFSEYFSSVEA